MQVGDPAGDRQAEAGAAPAIDVAEGAEAFEGTLAIGGGNSGALIGDVEVPVPRAPAAARRVTVPSGGLCLEALSSRLATSWRSRAASPFTTRSGGLTSTSYETSRPPTWISATADSSNAMTSTSSYASGALPASTRRGRADR